VRIFGCVSSQPLREHAKRASHAYACKTSQPRKERTTRTRGRLQKSVLDKSGGGGGHYYPMLSGLPMKGRDTDGILWEVRTAGV
jgi:dihydroxyacetone kinase